MYSSPEVSDEFETAEYDELESFNDGMEKDSADQKLFQEDRLNVWSMIEENVRYLGLILAADKKLVDDRDAMKYKYADLAKTVETAIQKVYCLKTAWNRDTIDEANGSLILFEKADVYICEWISIDDEHQDRVTQLKKLTNKSEKFIAQQVMECRQRLDWFEDDKQEDTNSSILLQDSKPATVQIDQLMELNYSAREVEELLKVGKSLKNTVRDSKVLKDDVWKICEEDGEVLELGMLSDRIQGILNHQNSYPRSHRDLNEEINFVDKESRPMEKSMVPISVQFWAEDNESASEFQNYGKKVQKLESKVGKLLNLMSSNIHPFKEGAEMMNLDETGKFLKSTKKVPGISPDHGLVQNMNVLMADSIQNHEQIAVFLSSLKSWLNKQTSQGVKLLKSHSEIKVIWKLLRDKRSGFEEEISKLMEMYQLLRHTVDNAATKFTENAAVIRNFWAQLNHLGDEIKELSSTVSQWHKKDLVFVEKLTSCSKMNVILRKRIAELGKEMLKFLELINVARKEIDALNINLWISQEAIINQEGKFINAADVQQHKSKEWKLVHKKMDVIEDERYEITSLHMELRQAFEELKRN